MNEKTFGETEQKEEIIDIVNEKTFGEIDIDFSKYTLSDLESDGRFCFHH